MTQGMCLDGGSENLLKEIARECGYKNPNGARQALLRVLEKVRFLVDLPEKARVKIVQKALDDYARHLGKHLDPDEAGLIWENRAMLRHSKDFRDFMRRHVNRFMRESSSKLARYRLFSA